MRPTGTRPGPDVAPTLRVFPGALNWLTVCCVESHGTPELVAVENLHSGDPITDINGGGQRYIVLESKAVGDGCVVLELESRVDHRLQVIEKSFPTGYHVGRANHRIL
ncbi:hypothetical protein LAUMK13_00054 [Mycobacterium innocens]|uniref:Uncharacterized protein n=1 Tax=Mycobacterium innocens TaxID=2341083 RepID=A0A498PKQ5_9MYCO|nr:hypothetical protein LAUMK13_00054 [Mycobacterium innocens]